VVSPEEYFRLLMDFRFSALWFEFTELKSPAHQPHYDRMWSTASERAFELQEQQFPAGFGGPYSTTASDFNQLRDAAFLRYKNDRSLRWSLNRLRYQENPAASTNLNSYVTGWARARIDRIVRPTRMIGSKESRQLAHAALCAVHVGLAGTGTTADDDLLRLASASLIRR
jgi:hypothetical protein